MTEERKNSALPFQRFLMDETSSEENRAVIRELLLDDSKNGEDPYAEIFESFQTGAKAVERRVDEANGQAEALARELEDALRTESVDRLADRVEAEPRFHTWALAENLRSRSFDAGFEEPERAVALAHLSIAVAEAVVQASGRALDRDLLAGAWGQYGNACRIASRLHDAEEALEEARRQRELGTGDALLHAQLLSFEASLCYHRSRDSDGLARCRKAARLYRRIGDRHGQGRMWLQEAGFLARLGEMAAAAGRLDRALAAIDVDAEPRLALVVFQNLICYLDLQARHDEAWQRLAEARELARGLGRRLDLVRLRWLEGRIAEHRDQPRHAETCLSEARRAFVELGIGHDASLVALELAALFSRQGRYDEMRELVEEMLPVFESLELRGEAQVALKIFFDAVRSRSADTEQIRELSQRIESSRPRLPGTPIF